MVRPIGTARRRTSSGAQRAETRPPTGRTTLAIRSVAKAATSQASARPKARAVLDSAPAAAIVQVVASARGAVDSVPAAALVPRAEQATEPASSLRAREPRTALVPAAPIASATGTCRAVVPEVPAAAETAMPSVAAAVDITARAPVHRATVALRARNLAAEEAAAARAVRQRRAERIAGAHR